jgi:hypothetical protein
MARNCQIRKDHQVASATGDISGKIFYLFEIVIEIPDNRADWGEGDFHGRIVCSMAAGTGRTKSRLVG